MSGLPFGAACGVGFPTAHHESNLSVAEASPSPGPTPWLLVTGSQAIVWEQHSCRQQHAPNDVCMKFCYKTVCFVTGPYFYAGVLGRLPVTEALLRRTDWPRGDRSVLIQWPTTQKFRKGTAMQCPFGQSNTCTKPCSICCVANPRFRPRCTPLPSKVNRCTPLPSKENISSFVPLSYAVLIYAD